MDAEKLKVFDNEYFAINRKLQMTTGLWPYASAFDKMVKRIFAATMLFVLAAPHILAIRIWCGKDLPLCGENLAGLIYCSGVAAKYIATIVCEKQITNAYKLLAENWLIIDDPEERQILLKYAAVGKMFSVVYVVYMVGAGVSFSQFSMLNPALDFFFPLNESRPKMLPTKGEFIIDPFKHFYEIYLLYNVLSFTSILVFVGVDTAYVAVVHQGLATFSIVEHRLVKATTFYLRQNEHSGYTTIISAIRMHKDALQFIDVIENSYGACLLYIVSMTAVFMGLGAITIMEHAKHPMDLVKYLMFVLGVILHLFYLSWPGQKVMDHSSHLFFQLYSVQWYKINKRGKTLLRFMMLKCFKPTLLTACGLYVMNFENYATILKTTLSYITVAISFHE